MARAAPSQPALSGLNECSMRCESLIKMGTRGTRPSHREPVLRYDAP
jgi:hypothetical protein